VWMACAVGLSAGCGATSPERASGKAPPQIRADAYGHLHAFDVYYRDLIADRSGLVRDWAIRYRAWNGAARTAYVVLPRWYAPHRDPAIPLVISPHGRGIEARRNLHFWGGLPALGPFALISPEGQGRVLTRYSCALRSPVHWAAAIAATNILGAIGVAFFLIALAVVTRRRRQS
jgi:hypothetical protein